MHYLTNLQNSLNKVLFNWWPDDEGCSSLCHLYDGDGFIVDDITTVDILARLSNLEGSVMSVIAMDRIGVGTDFEDKDDFQDLTENQVALLNFALDLGEVIKTKYINTYKYKSLNNIIADIIKTANLLFKDTSHESLFDETFKRASGLVNNYKNHFSF